MGLRDVPVGLRGAHAGSGRERPRRLSAASVGGRACIVRRVVDVLTALVCIWFGVGITILVAQRLACAVPGIRVVSVVFVFIVEDMP